jgi:hypothetical protein
MMAKNEYQGYENWLKANNIEASSQYIGYLRTIEKELGVKDFHAVKMPALLEKWRIELQARPRFASRGETDKNNLLSGFKKYIEFVRSKSPARAAK